MQSKAGTWQSEQRQKVSMMGDSTNQMSACCLFLYVACCVCTVDAIWASKADKRAITWLVGYGGYLPPSRHPNRVTQVHTEGTSGEAV